ncbi:triose-phosphate isomerase [Filomicrobium sp.]|uniref:triose-phosphate isomerase n=1 Tax=Filomicrobium sp. TaxID=2024831 RepID=UPI00258E5E1F|nr:triose-phosphate isomerase [Filomicrobium sp.]MCV0369365.1 triose-phosphate isomerase [Filomicrobium sp.]
MTDAGSPLPAIQPLVAGNWKMNGTKAALAEVIAISDWIDSAGNTLKADTMICPPATLTMVMAELCSNGKVLIGGQDCHPLASGAHTGDISAEMLADAGASAVILGHSERRSDHAETDNGVRAKVEAAHRAGLTAIVCVGETAGQRGAGLTLPVVARQLEGSIPDAVTAENTIVAYEPVWAIGTGLTPTADDVAEVHAMIREALQKRFDVAGIRMRILYGGSVKGSNAAELMSVANVNGALVGGASLKAVDLIQILEAYCK